MNLNPNPKRFCNSIMEKDTEQVGERKYSKMKIQGELGKKKKKGHRPQTFWSKQCRQKKKKKIF